MRPNDSLLRRVSVVVLSCIAVATMSGALAAEHHPAVQPDEPGKQPATADSPADSPQAGNEHRTNPAPSRKVVLTVVVTGNGKPVSLAEVKVKFPPSVGGELTLQTNAQGEATFTCAGTGTAKVRVVAEDWATSLQDVVLAGGPQRFTVALRALPDQ